MSEPNSGSSFDNHLCQLTADTEARSARRNPSHCCAASKGGTPCTQTPSSPFSTTSSTVVEIGTPPPATRRQTLPKPLVSFLTLTVDAFEQASTRGSESNCASQRGRDSYGSRGEASRARNSTLWTTAVSGSDRWHRGFRPWGGSRKRLLTARQPKCFFREARAFALIPGRQ